MCIIYMPDAHEGQERALDPLEWELQMVMTSDPLGVLLLEAVGCPV